MSRRGKKSILSICRNTILKNESYVSPLTRINDSILGEKSSVGWFNQIKYTNIGIGVSIGSHCNIGALNHLYHFPVQRFSKRSFNKKIDNTIIGHDVWIGSHCTIMSGVKIGIGAIIACNSFVSTDVGDYEIVGGTPATLIKQRFSPEIVAKLIKLEPWMLDDNILVKLFSEEKDMEKIINTLGNIREK